MASPESDTTIESMKRDAAASGPTLLGVLNLSPESMVSDSIAQTSEEILARAASLRAAGVEILDVGGRSITPDAPMIDDTTEQRRLLPAIELLVRSGYRVSADTWSSETGIAALDAGAEVVKGWRVRPAGVVGVQAAMDCRDCRGRPDADQQARAPALCHCCRAGRGAGVARAPNCDLQASVTGCGCQSPSTRSGVPWIPATAKLF